MTLEEQVQEIKDDIEEVKRLIESTTRPRVKHNLEVQQRKFEKELAQIEEKLEKEKQEREAASQTDKVNCNNVATRSYTKDISVYAWDQTDNFVKIYVDNLNGVGDLPENQTQCSFEKNGFHLQVQNLKNINYSLKRISLLHDIQPDQSSFKVKKDKIIINLRKVESKQWDCLLQEEKRTPYKPLPKLDKLNESNESLMDTVQDMYDNGDDDVKRAIAKAWTESREQMNATVNKTDDSKAKKPGIIRTPEFTFYPPQ